MKVLNILNNFNFLRSFNEFVFVFEIKLSIHAIEIRLKLSIIF